MSDKQQVIIIKKVQPGHDDHEEHGGAWKVAYADFMTAMMAFFLLLWLLSLSEEDKLQGIAEYFSPTEISLTSYGGQDILEGEVLDEVVREGLVDPDDQVEDIVRPIPGSEEIDPDAGVSGNEGVANPWTELTHDDGPAVGGSMAEAKEILEAQLEENGELGDLSENVLLKEDGKSLIIEIIEVDGSPLFASGKAELTAANLRILQGVAIAIKDVKEEVSITGHTDSAAFRSGSSYTNWELSADRANATRRALRDFGIGDSRIGQVGGVADREPINITNPTATENRRVTLKLTSSER